MVYRYSLAGLIKTSVYKGKGDALECGSYRGIKLLDQVMKVMERVIEKRIRSRVQLDEMQFGFRPGRGTTDAIFIVRQLQEKYLGKKKELWMAFLDLEKAFDRVPREVVWWALRQMDVDGWLINAVKSMYKNAKTSVKVNGVGGRDFSGRGGSSSRVRAQSTTLYHSYGSAIKEV